VKVAGVITVPFANGARAPWASADSVLQSYWKPEASKVDTSTKRA